MLCWTKGSNGWNSIQPGQPLGKLGSHAVKYQLNALVAIDPEKNTPLMQHYEGLTKHSDNIKFALQLQLDKTGSSILLKINTPVPLWKRLALRMV